MYETYKGIQVVHESIVYKDLEELLRNELGVPEIKKSMREAMKVIRDCIPAVYLYYLLLDNSHIILYLNNIVILEYENDGREINAKEIIDKFLRKLIEDL